MHEIIITSEQYLIGIKSLAKQISKKLLPIDLIIGIGRWGIIPATWISNELKIGCGYLAAESYSDGRVQKQLIIANHISTTRRIRGRLLLIDDLTDSGNTITKIRDKIYRKRPLVTDIKTAVMFYKEVSDFIPDVYYKKIPADENNKCPWLIQPWDHEMKQ